MNRQPRPPRPPFDRQAPARGRFDRPPGAHLPTGRPQGGWRGSPQGEGQSAIAFRPRAAEHDAPPRPFDPRSLLDEGDELVAGRRPVEEAFAARRESRRLLVVPTRRSALDALVLHATTLRIPVIEVEGGTLTALAGFDGHQGVALVVAPRRWGTLDEIIVRALDRGERPFVLALDSLEDPHNVGSLLRSADAAGVHGVIFPIRRAAPITASAVKASAGAVEHLVMVPVADLPGALADLHVRGLRIVGAEQSATLTYREADLRGPLVIVVGSEGQGIGPAIRRRLDLAVRIPMHGRIASLNAAVAGSVLLLEAAGQRALGAPVSADGETAAERGGAGAEAMSDRDVAAEPLATSEGDDAVSEAATEAEPDALLP